jgi:mRNA interferase RelE/StbE
VAHRIEVSPAAARQLKKIDRRPLTQIAEKIDSLAVEPRPHGCEKLSGYENLYRVRVGDYRIVYGVEDRLVLVAVAKVGNPAQIYQRLRDSDVEFLRGLVDPERGSTEPER